MGLFSRRRDETRSEEPAQTVTPEVSDVLLRAVLGGETITREQALTLPPVAGAVDFLGNCVACMPVKLYRRVDDVNIEEIRDDPRTRLLNSDTGDTLDAWQMKKAMIEDYLLGKGGYAHIRRDRNKVTGLFYVSEENVSIDSLDEPIFKHYQISVNGETFEPWEFIKLLRNTKDGASGVGMIAEVSKAIDTAYQTLLYQLRMAKSGGTKKGFLKAKSKLDQESIDALKSAWKRLYAQSEENVIVLNNGLEFQEASASSVELQLMESKRVFGEEVDNLFHIKPDFNSTYKEAIYPIVKAFETALNRDLLLEKEKGKIFFEFDVKEIIKASVAERYSAYRTAKETGFLTINEIRRAENLNHIDGMDVINVGLGAVLFDTENGLYYTPNTDTISDPKNPQGNMAQEEMMPPEEAPDALDDLDDAEIDKYLDALEKDMLAEDEEDDGVDAMLDDLEKSLLED